MDFFRFVCVVFMVLIHAFFWLVSFEGRVTLPPDSLLVRLFPVGMVFAFFPCLLPFTAGCALRLGLGWQTALPALSWSRVRQMALAGAGVGCMGMLLNYLSSGASVIDAWNVLQMVGLSVVCSALLLRRGSIWPLACVGALVVICAPLFRAWLLEPPAGDAGGVIPGRGALWAASDWYITKVLFGDPTGYNVWPVFPWAGTFAAGVLFTHTALTTGIGSRRFYLTLLPLGSVLVVGAALTGELVPRFDSGDFMGSAVYFASPGAIAGLLGVALCLVTIFTATFARTQFAPRGIVKCFSRGILWAYLAHLVFGRWVIERVQWDFDRVQLIRDPLRLEHLSLLISFPLWLLLVAWLAGWLAVRWLDGVRLRFTFRKVAPPAGM